VGIALIDLVCRKRTRPLRRSATGRHGRRPNPKSATGPFSLPPSPRRRQRWLPGKPASSPRTVAAGLSLLRPRRTWDLRGGGLLRRGNIGSAASDARGCGPAPAAFGTAQSRWVRAMARGLLWGRRLLAVDGAQKISCWCQVDV
jgi:hypothetical protein